MLVEDRQLPTQQEEDIPQEAMLVEDLEFMDIVDSIILFYSIIFFLNLF